MVDNILLRHFSLARLRCQFVTDKLFSRTLDRRTPLVHFVDDGLDIRICAVGGFQVSFLTKHRGSATHQLFHLLEYVPVDPAMPGDVTNHLQLVFRSAAVRKRDGKHIPHQQSRTHRILSVRINGVQRIVDRFHEHFESIRGQRRLIDRVPAPVHQFFPVIPEHLRIDVITDRVEHVAFLVGDMLVDGNQIVIR